MKRNISFFLASNTHVLLPLPLRGPVLDVKICPPLDTAEPLFYFSIRFQPYPAFCNSVEIMETGEDGEWKAM